jgi:hypothetical protein
VSSTDRSPRLRKLLQLTLERAEILPRKEMPADAVTMRSMVVFEDVDTSKRTEFVLVYPEEAKSFEREDLRARARGNGVLGLKMAQSYFPGEEHGPCARSAPHSGDVTPSDVAATLSVRTTLPMTAFAYVASPLETPY